MLKPLSPFCKPATINAIASERRVPPLHIAPEHADHIEVGQFQYLRPVDAAFGDRYDGKCVFKPTVTLRFLCIGTQNFRDHGTESLTKFCTPVLILELDPLADAANQSGFPQDLEVLG